MVRKLNKWKILKKIIYKIDLTLCQALFVICIIGMFGLGFGIMAQIHNIDLSYNVASLLADNHLEGNMTSWGDTYDDGETYQSMPKIYMQSTTRLTIYIFILVAVSFLNGMLYIYLVRDR